MQEVFNNLWMVLNLVYVIAPIEISVLTKIINKHTISTFSKGKAYIRELPDSIKHNPQELKEELYNEKSEVLKDSVAKLCAYTSEDCWGTVANNLKGLKEVRNMFLICIGLAGGYNIVKNKISIASKKSYDHEFMHLASSFYDAKNDVAYSGFSQQVGSIKIGESLNEGYTELIASRVFNRKAKTYKWERRITELFEFFFDDPKDMEKYYFNHDLPGFIRHLENYATREEIINLLLNLDYLTPILYISGPDIICTYINIQLTLYKWFKRRHLNSEKLQAFENKLYENKFISFIKHNKTIRFMKNDILEENMGIKL